MDYATEQYYCEVRDCVCHQQTASPAKKAECGELLHNWSE